MTTSIHEKNVWSSQPSAARDRMGDWLLLLPCPNSYDHWGTFKLTLCPGSLGRCRTPAPPPTSEGYAWGQQYSPSPTMQVSASMMAAEGGYQYTCVTDPWVPLLSSLLGKNPSLPWWCQSGSKESPAQSSERESNAASHTDWYFNSTHAMY